MTRTVHDGSNSFQEVYSISWNADGTSSTHITYPQNDETVVNFSGLYEVSRHVYQGPASGNVQLLATQTCYNNDSTCNPLNATSPITARDAYTTRGGVTSRVYTSYDSGGLGLPIEIDNYDFTSTTWGNPLKKTLITYATNLGNIVNLP